MYWHTLAIITALVSLASIALVVGRRWGETAADRFARLERDLAESSAEVSDTATLLRDRLDTVQQRLDGLDRRTANIEQLMTKQPAKIVASTRKAVDKDLAATFGQLEALQNLYAISPPDRPLPASRSWAASPDLLLVLVGLVESRRPALIVECGSGLSTLWLATALRRYELGGRVVALEHDAEFAEQTRTVLRDHRLEPYVEVRHAPLTEFRLAETDYSWYDRTAWSDLESVGMLFVDGPPGIIGPLARYPALPLLSTRLGGEATIVLDDMGRSDEQEVLRQWLDDDPGFSVEQLPLEKKATILTRRPCQ